MIDETGRMPTEVEAVTEGRGRIKERERKGEEENR